MFGQHFFENSERFPGGSLRFFAPQMLLFQSKTLHVLYIFSITQERSALHLRLTAAGREILPDRQQRLSERCNKFVKFFTIFSTKLSTELWITRQKIKIPCRQNSAEEKIHLRGLHRAFQQIVEIGS